MPFRGVLALAALLVCCRGGSTGAGGDAAMAGADGGIDRTAGTGGGGAAGGSVARTGGSAGGTAGVSAGGAAGVSAGGAAGVPAGGAAGGRGGGGSAGEAGHAGAGGETRSPGLGMTDVTILAPLPASSETAVLLKGSDLADDGTALVSRVLFDRLAADDTHAGTSILAPDAYARLHLVAVRFDLCDRHLPGPCPVGEDGRMRLVFQPVSLASADDVGFHAFYEIRQDELGDAIAALRELAKIDAKTPAPAGPTGAAGGPLTVSPPLGGPSASLYATKLRAWVKRYGGDTRNVRLTMNAQPRIFAQVRWALRGVEKKSGAFVDMAIVGAPANVTTEAIVFNGNASYGVMPASDLPAGIAGAIVAQTFALADLATQRAYLDALASAENPLTHTAETVPCFACHVSTAVTAQRAFGSTVELAALPGRYRSTYDLSTTGGQSSTMERSQRALGYIGKTTLISQRVVNETAQTLTEIAARFPAP